MLSEKLDQGSGLVADEHVARLSRRGAIAAAATAALGAGLAAFAPAARAQATAGPARDVHNKAPHARLTTLHAFPPRYFLESIAVRPDHSFLISVLNTRELWYVPPPGSSGVAPIRLHTFGQPALGIHEVEPDVFYVISGNVYTTREAYLHRLDLRNWTPGAPAEPRQVFQFPVQARACNGLCLVNPGVLLVADSLAGLIWRVDLGVSGSEPKARVWLAHDSMGYFPGKMRPEQPGVNGVRYASKTSHLYYTATAKKLLMRVPVDPRTFEAAGAPELVVAGRMGDGFILDEEAHVIYLTTHRQNTIDIVSMDPGYNSGFAQIVAGDPLTRELIGPSCGAWGRQPGDMGRVAYFVTDGGTASSLPTGLEPARLLRVEFQPFTGAFPGVTA
jgi:hypothetical protein